MEMESDSELVRMAVSGDRQAYERLFRRHERSVLASVLAVLGDYHTAQDVAQEAFAVAYAKLGTLCKRSSFGPWVRKIARREAIDIRRTRRRHRAAAPSALEVCDPSQDGCLDEENCLLLEAVARLPRHEQEVLTLRYFDGHSVKTISEMTGRPVGTVTMQLSRARSRLHKWLKESLT
jgi:RNA polymerase sigma-70 factor (ECF subfamily)